MNKLFMLSLIGFFTMSILTACSDAPLVSKEHSMPESMSMLSSSDTQRKFNPAQSDDLYDQSPRTQKLIKTGQVVLESPQLNNSFHEIENLIQSVNGYIASYNASKTSIRLSARIPFQQFDSFFQSVSELSALISSSVNTQDITDQYMDLETRLENRRLLLDKYRDYLDRASTIQEILDVEREINNLLTEMEVYEGRLRYLSDQVDYSTVTITLQLRQEELTELKLPSLSLRLKQMSNSILTFFYNMIFLVLYIVIFGVPMVLLLALFYYLAFGKIGLIRRLFNRLK